MIYKILMEAEWQGFRISGSFAGAPVDLADGYIHFSTRYQVEETARKHFSGHELLVLVAVNPDRIATQLKYELSRGGDLFPHYYGTLMIEQIEWAKPLPLGADGRHDFSGLLV